MHTCEQLHHSGSKLRRAVDRFAAKCQREFLFRKDAIESHQLAGIPLRFLPGSKINPPTKRMVRALGNIQHG